MKKEGRKRKRKEEDKKRRRRGGVPWKRSKIQRYKIIGYSSFIDCLFSIHLYNVQGTCDSLSRYVLSELPLLPSHAPSRLSFFSFALSSQSSAHPNDVPPAICQGISRYPVSVSSSPSPHLPLQIHTSNDILSTLNASPSTHSPQPPLFASSLACFGGEDHSPKNPAPAALPNSTSQHNSVVRHLNHNP